MSSPEIASVFPKWLVDANTDLIMLVATDFYNNWTSMHNADTDADYVVVSPDTWCPLQLSIYPKGTARELYINRYNIADSAGGTQIYVNPISASAYYQMTVNFGGVPTFAPNNYVNYKTENPFTFLGVATS